MQPFVELEFFTDYKGLEVVNTDDDGADRAADEGTRNLTDNFMELADRAPVHADRDPEDSDNADAGYEKGDMWLNTVTNTLFICVGVTPGYWQPVYERTNAALFVRQAGGSMLFLIDGEGGGGNIASCQLRNRGNNPGRNRTVLYRQFDTHATDPDLFEIQHRVDDLIKCRLAMTGDGDLKITSNSTILTAKPVDTANIDNEQVGISIDGNNLKFTVRDGSGAIKVGMVALS